MCYTILNLLKIHPTGFGAEWPFNVTMNSGTSADINDKAVFDFQVNVLVFLSGTIYIFSLFSGLKKYTSKRFDVSNPIIRNNM